MANPLVTVDVDINDPLVDLKDGLIDPSKKPPQQEPPGFFSSLRNPVELFLEESLPASLYQWITGNTKKVQAEKALKFLQQYPYLQNSTRYKEAERIYKKFVDKLYICTKKGDKVSPILFVNGGCCIENKRVVRTKVVGGFIVFSRC